MSDISYAESMGLKLSDKSFADCLIDPSKAKLDILDSYPALKSYPEFLPIAGKFETDEVSNSQVIAYICCMYDPGSPFVKHFDNYQERKIAVAEYVGFRRYENGNFSQATQKILNAEEPAVRAMTIRYCAQRSGAKLAAYVRLLQVFYERTLMSASVTAVKIDADMKALDAYQNAFLQNDKSPELTREFYRIAAEEEKRLIALRPESQAAYWENEIMK